MLFFLISVSLAQYSCTCGIGSCDNGELKDSNSGSCQSCSYFLTGSETCTCSCSCDGGLICQGTPEVTTCVNGYYNADGYCAQCPGACSTCDGSGACTSCPIGLVLESGWCSIPNCSSQSGASCRKCADGYFIFKGLCEQCGKDCTECSSPTKCTICNTGFSSVNGTCLIEHCMNSISNLCAQCEPGYYPLNGICMACASSCATCTNSSKCDSCPNGWSFISGRCVLPHCLNTNNILECLKCETGFYLTADRKSCAACSPMCIACADATTCTSCQQSMLLLQNGSCACKETADYVTAAGTCQPGCPGLINGICIEPGQATCSKGWHNSPTDLCTVYNCSEDSGASTCGGIGTCEAGGCVCGPNMMPVNGTCTPAGSLCDKCVGGCIYSYILERMVCLSGGCTGCTNGYCAPSNSGSLQCVCREGMMLKDDGCYASDCGLCSQGTCKLDANANKFACTCDEGYTFKGGDCVIANKSMSPRTIAGVVMALVLLIVGAVSIWLIIRANANRKSRATKQNEVSFGPFSVRTPGTAGRPSLDHSHTATN